MYGAESPPQPSTPEQLTTRTPTRSNAAAASESIGMQSLVRQTSAPSVGLQKSFTKLYSFTTLSGGMSGHFERSPARSTVGPIAEGDGETREVYHPSHDDAWGVPWRHMAMRQVDRLRVRTASSLPTLCVQQCST